MRGPNRPASIDILDDPGINPGAEGAVAKSDFVCSDEFGRLLPSGRTSVGVIIGRKIDAEKEEHLTRAGAAAEPVVEVATAAIVQLPVGVVEAQQVHADIERCPAQSNHHLSHELTPSSLGAKTPVLTATLAIRSNHMT